MGFESLHPRQLNMRMKKALLYSGGVESTLILYKLSQENLNLYLVNRFNSPISKALHLYNVIKQDLNIEPTLTILDLSHLEGHEQLREARKQIMLENDLLYVGACQYPDDEKAMSLLMPGYKFNFDKLRNDPEIEAPLIDMDKSQTIQEYYNLNIQKYLPLTKSCGDSKDEPCKKCFNCTERAWAYNRLGIEVDYGA